MTQYSFPGFQAWPTDMLAKRQEILDNMGIHYLFQAGRRAIAEGGKVPNKFLPDTLFDGWTVRWFMYAADLGEQCFLSVYYKGSQFWYNRVDTGSGTVETGGQEGNFSFNYRRRATNYTIKKGEVYTVSIRIENNQYLDAYFNDNKISRSYVKQVRGYHWDLWYDTGDKQRILSVHCSNESNEMRSGIHDYPYIAGMYVNLGTVAIYKLMYAGGDTITTYIKQLSGSDITIDTPVNNKLKGGDPVTCVIRLTSKYFSVQFSISDQPAIQPPRDLFHNLHVYFSGNMHVIRATYVLSL